MKYFFITALLCLAGLKGISQNNIYQYPIRPGSVEWKSLTTAQDRINACDIPQPYFEKASTTDLLASCLSNPLLFEVLASNSLLISMGNLCSQLKAFQVLRQRPDYNQVLLDYYHSSNPKSIMYITDDMEKFKYSLQYLYIELLLADKIFLKSLTESERKSLAQQLLVKIEIKNQLTDYYRYFGTVGSLLGLAQLLLVNSEKNRAAQVNELDISKIKNLLDNHIGYSKDVSAYILQEGYNFTK